MPRTIKARFHQGKFQPLEPLEIEEGTEVVVLLPGAEPAPSAHDTVTPTFGAWRDLLDCETFEKDLYESRLLRTRPDVEL